MNTKRVQVLSSANVTLHAIGLISRDVNNTVPGPRLHPFQWRILFKQPFMSPVYLIKMFINSQYTL